MLMNGNDKKKIAQTIVKQIVSKEVPDVEYDAELGFEACARDIISAVENGNIETLKQALITLSDLVVEKTNYQSGESIEIEG